MENDFIDSLSCLKILGKDWDAEGDEAPDHACIDMAIAYLKEANIFFKEKYFIDLPKPQVIPDLNGDIDIIWDLQKQSLVISCQKENGLYEYVYLGDGNIHTDGKMHFDILFKIYKELI